MLHFRDHVIERPDLGTPLHAQVRRFQEMIAVHVRNDDRVDGLESEVIAQTIQRSVEELLVEQAAVGEQRMAVLRQDERKVRPEIQPFKLKQMRRNLPNIRNDRWL